MFTRKGSIITPPPEKFTCSILLIQVLSGPGIFSMLYNDMIAMIISITENIRFFDRNPHLV